jgi:hypothetical protein
MRLTRSQQTTEIDAKIAANATHVISETQETRLSVPTDFLPVERVQFQEQEDLEVTDFETTTFNKLVRQDKKSGSSSHVFQIGDTVIVKSSTQVPIVAVIISFHKTSLKNSSHQKQSNLQWHSPLKALVHRFELAGTTKVNRTFRAHEPVSPIST